MNASATAMNQQSDMSDVNPNPRALVVDDHADTAELFQMLLTKRGIDVITAGTLEAALLALKTNKFDILISDIDLPDGSGCDLLEEVRRVQALPAIAVSGLGGENILKRCKEVGFDELFVKPASFQRVLDATLRLLSAATPPRSE
jgi:two-component system CheB/CheR fusion protein